MFRNWLAFFLFLFDSLFLKFNGSKSLLCIFYSIFFLRFCFPFLGCIPWFWERPLDFSASGCGWVFFLSFLFFLWKNKFWFVGELLWILLEVLIFRLHFCRNGWWIREAYKEDEPTKVFSVFFRQFNLFLVNFWVILVVLAYRKTLVFQDFIFFCFSLL